MRASVGIQFQLAARSAAFLVESRRASGAAAGAHELQPMARHFMHALHRAVEHSVVIHSSLQRFARPLTPGARQRRADVDLDDAQPNGSAHVVFVNATAPVSYTHLDVYKRQA